MTLILVLILWPHLAARADSGAEAELRAIRSRLERLEAAGAGEQAGSRPGANGAEGTLGRVLRRIELSGDVVAVGQGTVGNEPGDDSGAVVAGELMLTARPSPAGTIGMRFLMVRGVGVSESGAVADTVLGVPDVVFEFNSDIPHVVEAWYEPRLFGGLAVATFGILDPTRYFDTNQFANDERTQFLGFPFVTNSGIDWGGDVDFYGPGVRLSLAPLDWLGVSLGGFSTHTVRDVAGVGGEQQDEIVGFDQEFDQPFAIIEADLKLSPLGAQGNYRLYGWYNGNDSKFELFHTGPDRASWGVGGSFDQELAGGLGAFARWSKQDQSVGRLNWQVSGGLSAKGAIPARPEDVAAVGYALGRLSAPFREAGGLAANEQWLEAYYSCQATPHLFLTPDFQYIVNPGGQPPDVSIWGLRALATF